MVLKLIAELKGIGRLEIDLFLAIFNPTIRIYQCPLCNQCIRQWQKHCDRCGSKIGWS